ncbi:MAG: sulfite exporter TauE/SafE family protein [Pseudanabaenaceae cyanobacterium SKYGB_i_bin29]|nr:sulfite exporter TauE/SafE family protein [Pseudanabaenaceae cyanobacterium SKYG29]MDW8422302.1 sulfite exporter TauE/SafE family protein [Pseudanabaenaceae cyanobacterium SKYGB_i_bin29]
MSFESFVLLEVIAFVASLVQALVGFGSSLIAVPSLLLLLDNAKIVAPLVTLSGLVINSRLVFSLRQYFRAQYLLPLVLGAILGIPFGVLILDYTPLDVLKFGLAVLIISYSVYSYWQPEVHLHLSNWWGMAVGFVAGCLGAALSSNGPPLVIWASLQDWNKDEFRSNLPAYFGITGAISLLAYQVSGLLTFPVWQYFFYTIPASVAGTFIGEYWGAKIQPDRFKQIIRLLLICLAVGMLVSDRFYHYS